MKANNYFKIFMLLIAALVFAAAAAAQEVKPSEGPPPPDHRPAAGQPHDTRPNMLRDLGLSPEQIQQIRSLNIEKRPLMVEAQKRFREANRALDEAIYADEVNESDVQARLKEVHLAQAEVARLRFMNELAVRRILTQEQLVRFREMRQRFEKERMDHEKHRRFNVDRQRPGKVKNQSPDGQPQQQRFVRPVKEKHVL